jgi:hypothetical protein
MSNTFLISDHHFSQESILKFTINDGTEKLRPEFSSVEEWLALSAEERNDIPVSKKLLLTDEEVVFNILSA